MALTITCPHCSTRIRFVEPYPGPGSQRQCSCGAALSISYPVGLVERMRREGARFDGEAEGGPAISPKQGPPSAGERNGGPVPREETEKERYPVLPVDPTEVAGHKPVAAPRKVEAAKPAPRPTVPIEKAPPPRKRPTGPLREEAAPTKPRRGWLGAFAGGIGAFVAVVVLAGLAVLIGGSAYYSKDLPSVEALGAYRPPTVTTVYDRSGQLMGEIYEKRRYVVPLDTMPRHLLQAFVAAEDASFYEHTGVDFMGILRAIGRNTLAGKKAQGASTITQQVARNFLLTSEKTFTRKIKEMLLARRIEATFDKDHILYLYLNQIYLGSGAYGVEAAARVYFDKHVGDLDLAEASLIAGLPQRPSDYSPHRHMEKAKARQSYVLNQMVENRMISRQVADATLDQPLRIVARKNEFLLKAPWFTEQVRRYLVEKYGQDRVYNDGIAVTTTCDLGLQAIAQEAVTDGVSSTDEKAGWRGATEHLEEAEIRARVAEFDRALDTLVEGERYSGVVTEVQKKHAVVDLGAGKAIVPLAWTEWAYRPDPSRNSKYRRQDDLSRALTRGDVVRVEVVHANFRDAAPLASYDDAGPGPFAAATLYQEPEMQGALLSYRLDDGAVVAMVGGVDFKDTQFNRAVQASRQVGSTFKPIVYAAAIASKEFTVATIVQDAPLVFNTLKSQLWKPENYGEDYLGDITLRRALALSRNVVTIRVLDVIGLDPVYAMARRLGVTSPLELDLSMGLGSGSLTMEELVRAYTPFATLGRKIEPHFVEQVVDRDGKVLESWTKPAEWERVLDPGVAGVMNWMLQEVASSGTAAKAQKLGIHVAGKTGTTNDFKDAWFIGYTPDVVTGVWVGYDQPRSLGESSTGGYTALPIWMEYHAVASPKEKDRPFPSAPGLDWAAIDDASGRPMTGGRGMPFLPGTSPRGAATEAGQVSTEDILTREW